MKFYSPRANVNFYQWAYFVTDAHTTNALKKRQVGITYFILPLYHISLNLHICMSGVVVYLKRYAFPNHLEMALSRVKNILASNYKSTAEIGKEKSSTPVSQVSLGRNVTKRTALSRVRIKGNQIREWNLKRKEIMYNKQNKI